MALPTMTMTTTEQARAQPRDNATANLPHETRVLIEVGRGDFVKRDDTGRFHYVSPFPCPFNYGSVPDTLAPDGARIDAVVFGGRITPGTELTLPVRGVIDFIDAGSPDPKWICSANPLTPGQLRLVTGFFIAYGPMKGALNLLQRKWGRTAYRGRQLR